jgi:phosphoglycolate phosphatase-like HAD superfamily hydrolase
VREVVESAYDSRDALMFGDTPTDVAAARAAGVAFVGYVGEGDEGAASALREAGAPAVVRRFDDFSHVIPW